MQSVPAGFLASSKKNASGHVYQGRFTCPEVQWTGQGDRAFCTFSITAAQLTDAALSDLIWTDQAVQRGIKPGTIGDVPREISLRNGYPDGRYIFDAENSDDMVNKLLGSEKLFLNPLVWNLRPGQFEAFFDEVGRSIYIYSGRIFLPDSHHRHQAIIKATKIKREAPDEYPNFSEDSQFKVELYFLSREDEGNYFFDKNQRPKPTALSKAYDLSTVDDLSVLAKQVVDNSKVLKGNVNRVTDRLSKSDSSVVTLATLREVMKSITSSGVFEETEMEGLSFTISSFFDKLGLVRKELGQLTRADRNYVRGSLLVDSAVMFHGYAALIRDYVNDIPKLGTHGTEEYWGSRLTRLSADIIYSFSGSRWSGDLFDKQNPFWEQLGVTKSNTSSGKLTVLNTGSARSACQRALRRIIRASSVPIDLKTLLD